MKRVLKVIGVLVLLSLMGCASNWDVPKEDWKEEHKEEIRAYEEAKKTTTVVIGEDVYEGVYLEEDYTPEELEKPSVPEEYKEEPEEYYEEYYEEEYYEEPYEYYEAPVSYGDHLTARGGVYWYGNQKETWYNLPMEGVISIMTAYGYSMADYWVREDGCKMLGEYIMVAANLDVHPRGTLVETSLGMGLVCDTGTFAYSNPYQIDIAVNW